MADFQEWTWTPHYIPAKGQPILPRSNKPWIEQSMTTGTPLLMDSAFGGLLRRAERSLLWLVPLMPVAVLWLINLAVVGVVRAVYRKYLKPRPAGR